MEQLSIEFKNKVALLLKREWDLRGFANKDFLETYGVDKYTCNKILNGKIDSVLPDSGWLRIGSKLGAMNAENNWKLARTDVFLTIEQDVIFCKENAKAKICVDECGIGKTFAAKHLASTLKNCFYVDASQGKSISLFTKNLAKALGLQSLGKHNEIKDDIKCYLKIIENPIVIIDEAGDLGQVALQEIKEFWNATEGYCGWYLMGADGLKYIIDKGIKNKKPGFKEIFSRFSERYTTTVPIAKDDRLIFYRKLITDVLKANMVEKGRIEEIVKRCMVQYSDGAISGLRRAESLLILYAKDDNQRQIEQSKKHHLVNN